MTAGVAEPIPLYREAQTFYVPAFEIKVRGAPMPRTVVRDIVEVSYEDSLDKVDGFTFVVNNWDADKMTGKYFGDRAEFPTLFQPGNEIQLLMGYQGTTPDLRKMVTGQLTSVDLELTETAAQRILVRGLNVLDRFRRKQYTWSWPETEGATIRDSEIAKLLEAPPNDATGQPGLGPKVVVRTDSDALLKETAQEYVFLNNKYPIVFLMERARKLGYSVVYEGTDAAENHVIYFGPSQRLRERVYLLEWGLSLQSLKVNFSTGKQVKKVTVLGWDRKAKKAISESATLEVDAKDLNPDLHQLMASADREEVIADEPIHTVADAKKRAKDALLDLSRQVVTVTGVTVGLPDLRAGRVVHIQKVDPRINGKYFVMTSSHVLNESGYRTTFTARREQPPGGIA